MTVHPDTERNSQSIADELTAEEALDQFERALRGLRSSIRQWSEDELAACRLTPRFVPRRFGMAGFALVATVAVLAVKLILIPQPAPPAPADLAVSDSVLLQEVNADVARLSPSSMEPLGSMTPVSPTLP